MNLTRHYLDWGYHGDLNVPKNIPCLFLFWVYDERKKKTYGLCFFSFFFLGKKEFWYVKKHTTMSESSTLPMFFTLLSNLRFVKASVQVPILPKFQDDFIVSKIFCLVNFRVIIYLKGRPYVYYFLLVISIQEESCQAIG